MEVLYAQRNNEVKEQEKELALSKRKHCHRAELTSKAEDNGGSWGS